MERDHKGGSSPVDERDHQPVEVKGPPASREDIGILKGLRPIKLHMLFIDVKTRKTKVTLNFCL